jgi:hypothetical protein
MWCVKARKLDEGAFVSNPELGDEESTVFQLLTWETSTIQQGGAP